MAALTTLTLQVLGKLFHMVIHDDERSYLVLARCTIALNVIALNAIALAATALSHALFSLAFRTHQP